MNRNKRVFSESFAAVAVAFLALTFCGATALGDVIPFCPYARLISEDITVSLRHEGGDIFADFTGDFVLEDLWPQYGSMVFPIPSNTENFKVFSISGDTDIELDTFWYKTRDYGIDGWPMVQRYYQTVLAEMPEMPVKLWNSPSEGGESFRVSYSHKLLRRGSEHVFVYALGAEDFPNPYVRAVSLTAETIVNFDIIIPENVSVVNAWYDDQLADSVSLVGDVLKFTPSGELHEDIIVTFAAAPEPTSFIVLLAGTFGVLKRKQ